MKPIYLACLTAILCTAMYCATHRYYVERHTSTSQFGVVQHGSIFDHWTGRIVKEW